MAKTRKRPGHVPRPRHPVAPRTPATRWRVGYLFVHGVGHQKPGDALQWGRNVIGTLQDVHGAQAVAWRDQPLSETRADRETRHAEVVLDIGGARRTVLFAEALWSRRFAELGRPSAWRTLVFVLSGLPLLLWIIGPDHRDLRALAPARGPARWFALHPETYALGRLLWRLATLAVLTLALGYGVALALAGSTTALVGSAVVLAGLAWLARSRMNLLWHVRVAALDEERTQALLSHLHRKLHWMEAQCDEVVVVAHSQGGYLMHRVLSPTANRSRPKVRRFIGVGSGLKPIGLLRSFDRSGLTTLLWSGILVMPGWIWGVWPLVGEPVGGCLRALVRVCSAALHTSLVPAAVLSDPEGSRQWWTAVAHESLRAVAGIPAPHLDLAHGAAVAGSLSLAVLTGRLIHAALLARPPYSLSLDHDRRRIEWREYTSPHDMVGRILSPGVPEDVDQPWISGAGHPLGDHVLYFHPTGVLPRRLAADLLADLAVAQGDEFARAADEWKRAAGGFDAAKRRQASRRRALHGLILGTGAAAVIAPLVLVQASIVQALLRAWFPFAVWLLLLTVLFTGISHLNARRAARTFTSRLTGKLQRAAKAWQVRIVPTGARAVPALAAATGGVIALFGCARFSLASIRQGDATLWPAWPLLVFIAAGLLLIACATAAGYPVRKRWSVLLGLILLLAASGPPAPQAYGLPWELRPEMTLVGCLAVCLLSTLAGTAWAQLKAVDLVELTDRPDAVGQNRTG
ncbi:hypothetical protein [Streptomyces sp. NBC_01233]|uniref:hypothetical protein n=1 Tax=Streptomyces sp. NBC_01233 TaxID=2903787 RepID=UPI002E10AA67|nr:hypothetical protein OG332_11590 [Streptomyces sp. NBC_01233]